MTRIRVISVLAMLAVLMTSCTLLHRSRASTEGVIPICHLHSTEPNCLVSCVDMVLGYYGHKVYFNRCPVLSHPAGLLTVDSLIRTLSSPDRDDPHSLRSFVLQEDESFLDEQLSRQRPLILIFHFKADQFHSVVLAGKSPDGRAYFIHDPIAKEGRWVKRAAVLKLWNTSGNTTLLVGLAPAGT